MNNDALQRSRLSYIDFARGIGIILVIIGHIENIYQSWRTFIVTFHMPFFFVLSGLLIYLKKEEEKSLKELALRKARTMLLPYVLFSVADILIFIIYYQIKLGMSEQDLPALATVLLQDVNYFFSLYGISVLWFLPALFMAEVIFLTAKKRLSNTGVIFVIFVMACICVMLCLDKPSADAAYLPLLLHALVRAGIASFFVMMGYELGALIDCVKKKSERKVIAQAITLNAQAITSQEEQENKSSVLQNSDENEIKLNAQAEDEQDKTKKKQGKTCVILCFVAGAVFMALGTGLGFLNGATDLRTLLLNKAYLYFPAAWLGSAGLLLMCRAFEGAADFFLFKILRFFGRESLTVMCTHLDWYILYLGIVCANNFMLIYPSPKLRLTVFVCVVVLVVLAVETLLILLKNIFLKKQKKITE